MLVLSRFKGETVTIGEDVEVTVVDIRGDQIRLGITAPPHVAVHRKEIQRQLAKQGRRHTRGRAAQEGDDGHC